METAQYIRTEIYTAMLDFFAMMNSLTRRFYKYKLILLCMMLSTASCQWTGSAGDSVRELTVLYTNDEHGWMEGTQEGNSAANLLGLWREKEGYSEDGPFLVLSGGDHWTGPAISTWFEGEGMVELMNSMAYDATAIGNHEFDFGLDNLQQRMEQADYPYLAANINWKPGADSRIEENNLIEFLPSTILELNDLRIGIAGLSTTETPQATNPINVRELDFTDYEPALRRSVADMTSEDVDMIFVVAHVCMAELEPLAEKIADLNISLSGGGHCNELVAQQVGDTILLEGGSNYRSYAKAKFSYDIDSGVILSAEYETVMNENGSADPMTAELVSDWRERADAELDSVLGYSPITLERGDDRLQRLVVSSWLAADSTADIAINNRPGLRGPLPRGEVTLGDIVGILPFENTIVAVELTGNQIVQILAEGQRPFVMGISRTEYDWRLSKTGRLLDAENSYRVLVSSFMYEGGSNYGSIAKFDNTPFDTEIHFRQPMVEWIRSRNSSAESPFSIP